ncbi:MAG TPA: hypothetical protein VFS94_00055 [Gemmatimonadales bacterium]|nr:hypothetical protein [Gemmatimonadales bacterium]
MTSGDESSAAAPTAALQFESYATSSSDSSFFEFHPIDLDESMRYLLSKLGSTSFATATVEIPTLDGYDVLVTATNGQRGVLATLRYDREDGHSMTTAFAPTLVGGATLVTQRMTLLGQPTDTVRTIAPISYQAFSELSAAAQQPDCDIERADFIGWLGAYALAGGRYMRLIYTVGRVGAVTGSTGIGLAFTAGAMAWAGYRLYQEYGQWKRMCG